VDAFTIGGAWRAGYRFVSHGFVIQFLILVVIGIAAPLGLQYALIGVPLDAASSPLTGGQAMMQSAEVPAVLLAVALSHMLQAGSFVAALRFGFSRERSPVGAILFGLAAGFVALVVVAAGYAIAIFGARAIASPATVELAVIMLILPLVVVYSLFFISQAIMAAATIVSTLLFLLIYGLSMGYPGLAAMAFGGSGLLTVMMIVMSILLFWLAARFSCVTALMAQRPTLNVFAAIRDSWQLTADEQGAIFRYLALVGFSIALLVLGATLAVGTGMGGLMQGGSLGADSTSGIVLRVLFGIPLAFLSVMLPAGIWRQLTVEEEMDAEIFA
jgi:hypothetical protein